MVYATLVPARRRRKERNSAVMIVLHVQKAKYQTKKVRDAL